MYNWLNWLNESEKRSIKHKMNNGNEKRVGPYLIDGYDSQTGELFEFLGCFYHGHDQCVKWKNKDRQRQRYDETLSRISFFRKRGLCSPYYLAMRV